ncbi:phenylalanine--tRNA ligase subunit alpha [Bradymonas sediminis]|uniref:Phenylalanine--tRNA ligase alpha subunit n=1 Tax=Bradymonas sediminis TaxID=1548548 RepID=A0A2Z4FI01_9DELT|nr:phenylalanine--tRNA ligase subunit alpha [Bradymonas sediminis]AWV88338.1 phenylalanine--tRNA ligase subunit alpha [Bradymonas sediminis]TDP77464.1 phenylalanyl-tRNA synthetase alpha subunit [Bradymonas sediminis]
MNISELETRLNQLAEQAVAEFAEVERKEDAIQVKNRYLGRKGGVQELMKLIRELPNDEKRLAGQASNLAKKTIQDAYDARNDMLDARELARQLAAETIDVTLPARTPAVRSGHPLIEVQQELISIFSDMGFEVAEGPEIEEDFYNFEALNFPADHPARDMQDTFMLDDGRLLRTHTSPVQVRTMLAYGTPVRVISPGRVYRCDADVTHSPVFHQVEGLLVDENITFADLKGTLSHFAERVFGPGTPLRFRPSFFPFTEPSAEVDIGCIFCEGSGCRICSHTGWLEILGSGMVDPNVFTSVGVDPEKYSGFAFGMGVERIAMLKLGVNDIRMFFDNDLRFLAQF